MAFLGKQYGPVTEEPQNEYDPIPSGDYLAMIVESELKPTKKGDGQYLECTYQIIEGALKGRSVWLRLNLENPNETAVRIAQQQLQKLQFACGGIAVQDSSQLHNIPHVIRVEFLPAAPPKRDRAGNEIRDFKRAEGVAAPSPFAGAPAANQPTGAPAAAPAWAQQRPAA